MTTTMRSTAARTAVLAALALAALPALAAAQQPTRRRQAPIVIKGQVPTPQIVTVRPREVPTYSRQVLVPRFYDHDFWPDIQTGYQMVPQRQISGRSALDSLGATGMPADSAPADSAAAPRSLTPPTAPQQRAVPSPGSPGTPALAPPTAAPADTTRRTPGTPSAPPAR